MRVKAALVDVDGTLVDSSYHHALAWSRALRDHSFNARLAAIHRLIGMGSSEMLRTLLGEPEDPDRDSRLQESWRTHFDALLPEVWPFEGAGDLLRALHDDGLTVVLATSSPQDLLTELRSKIGADDAIDLAICADDVDRAKPSPDIFDVALERSGVEAPAAVAIGDAVWDVQAARRADIRCVGLETGGVSRQELESAGAEAVFEDPLSLLRALAEHSTNVFG
jgi:HAD superfamily hydrolase (TIGR01509 family)